MSCAGRLLQMGVTNTELWTNLGICCFYASQWVVLPGAWHGAEQRITISHQTGSNQRERREHETEIGIQSERERGPEEGDGQGQSHDQRVGQLSVAGNDVAAYAHAACVQV